MSQAEKIKEAIAKLETIVEIKDRISPDYSEHTIKLACDEMYAFADAALAILRPLAEPSPDCQEPEAEKFTKEFRECLAEDKEFFVDDGIPEDVYKIKLSFLIANAEQACDIINRLSAKTLHQSGSGQEAGEFIRETRQAMIEFLNIYGERSEIFPPIAAEQVVMLCDIIDSQAAEIKKLKERTKNGKDKD